MIKLGEAILKVAHFVDNNRKVLRWLARLMAFAVIIGLGFVDWGNMLTVDIGIHTLRISYIDLLVVAIIAAIALGRSREVSASDDFLSVDLRALGAKSSRARRARKKEKAPLGVVSEIAFAAEQGVPAPNQHPFIAPPPTSFTEYFLQIVATLESKANAADEKASILLNKGTAYTKGGVMFYVASIVCWQAVIAKFEFKTQFIYGIASCSFVFAFVEFLSAWFLRQYRHFVDTSTYLLRVKAILDRYLLAYLAAKEQAAADGTIDGKAFATLNKMLEEAIRWPETELFDKANASFATEALESITTLAKELRNRAK